MPIQFPPIFKTYWKAPGVVAAFVSEAQPHHPADCPNCGGMGSMTTFVAHSGPFNAPPVGKNIISHTGKDNLGRDKWWGGKNFNALCPVCQGSGRRKDYTEPPAVQRNLDFTGVGNQSTGERMTDDEFMDGEF